MSRKLLLTLGLTAIASLSAYMLFNQSAEEPKKPHKALSTLSDAPQGGNFTLSSLKGPISLSDYQGKWVYLYFGYTFCPDICPTNLGNLSMAYHMLNADEKSKLQFIFISVDPNRDTPERLAEYANYFDMNLIGATGSSEDIENISRNYGAVYVSHQSDKDDKYYPVDHSAFTYVVNPQGKLVGQLPHGTGSEMFINSIRTNLNGEQK